MAPPPLGSHHLPLPLQANIAHSTRKGLSPSPLRFAGGGGNRPALANVTNVSAGGTAATMERVLLLRPLTCRALLLVLLLLLLMLLSL